MFEFGRSLEEVRVILPQGLNLGLLHTRAEKAGAFSGPRKSGLFDHMNTIFAAPAPFVKWIVHFVFLVYCILWGRMLDAARLSNIIADVFVDTLPAGPHRFAWRVVVAVLILCSDLMLEGTPFKAVGHGGQRFAVDALLLQRQTVSVLVIVLHECDLR